LIAFDLDGTLIDSRRDLADSANQLIEELGGARLSEEAIGRMVGEGASVLVRRALHASGLGDVPGALARFLAIYDGRLLNHTRPYEGIEDAVRVARAHARVAILTNKPVAPTLRLLQAFAMWDLFDDVVGGDNALGRKPDPAALQALMRAAGAAPDHTMMVGDSEIDHETALRAGVRTCLVTFGFGFSNFARERLVGTEQMAHTPSQLTEEIARFCGST
jgi:phosphoglycolate phosphatase